MNNFNFYIQGFDGSRRRTIIPSEHKQLLQLPVTADPSAAEPASTAAGAAGGPAVEEPKTQAAVAAATVATEEPKFEAAAVAMAAV